MAPQAQALIEASKATQLRIATLTVAMILTLGGKLQRGALTEAEFTAAFMAGEKLGHDQAALRMAEFITAYRRLVEPDTERAAPVLDEFDRGASYGRATGTVDDLRQLDRTQADYDREFTRIITHAATVAFRHTLNGGRDTMAWSAAANGTRWRRVTGAKPCAFCVMLATRSDYRTKESALTVVGRASGYRAIGQVNYTGRARGKRPLGARFHDHCTCTVVEVVGDQQMTPREQAQHDLYQRAAEQCDADGVRRTDKNVIERMERLDNGTVLNKPETQASGTGGGRGGGRGLQSAAGAGAPVPRGSQRVPYDGTLGASRAAPPELALLTVAPLDDPLLYLATESKKRTRELALIEWLREHDIENPRTILERNEQYARTPDLAWNGGTIEGKKADTTWSSPGKVSKVLRDARHQSRNVYLDLRGTETNRDVAEAGIRDALRQSGEDFGLIVVILPDASSVYWAP